MKTLNLANATSVQLVEELQCTGCVIGSDTTCGRYRKGQYGQCASHAMGTMAIGAGLFALGFPKGFNRPGLVIDGHSPYGPMMTAKVRTWMVGDYWLETSSGESYGDLGGDGARFNVPVARTMWNGQAVVFVHSPRTNRLTVLLFDKLSASDEKAIAGTIRLDADVLDPDGPSPERLVGIDYRRPFNVRFWTGGEKPTYVDTDTRATWALEQDGLLFVRVCRPATAELWVDVVTGGKRAEIAPNAVNAGELFIKEID